MGRERSFQEEALAQVGVRVQKVKLDLATRMTVTAKRTKTVEDLEERTPDALRGDGDGARDRRSGDKFLDVTRNARAARGKHDAWGVIQKQNDASEDRVLIGRVGPWGGRRRKPRVV